MENAERIKQLQRKRMRLIANLRRWKDPTMQFNIKMKIDKIEEELCKITKTTY